MSTNLRHVGGTSAIAIALSMCSCATHIHSSGKFVNHNAFGSARDQIHAELGDPVVTGEHYDIYKIRRHLPERNRAFGTAVLSVMTLGTAEVIMLPIAVAHWSADSALRRYALFYFDSAGNLAPPPHKQSTFIQPFGTTSRRLEDLKAITDIPYTPKELPGGFHPPE
jgi:hypothetical protein